MRLLRARVLVRIFAVAIASALGVSATPADAEIIDVDLTLTTDILSYDDFGDSLNERFLLDLSALGVGAGSSVLGIAWDVELFADSPSWLSELSLYVSDSTTTSPASFFLSPGFGDDFAGTSTYTSGGVINLADVGLPDLFLADGLIYLEFYESFDDYLDDWDGVWLEGSTITLRINAVPEPSSVVALVTGAGVLGLIHLRRRRRRVAA